jgi:hypothetical protein
MLRVLTLWHEILPSFWSGARYFFAGLSAKIAHNWRGLRLRSYRGQIGIYPEDRSIEPGDSMRRISPALATAARVKPAAVFRPGSANRDFETGET